ncbi:hypothetical protein P9139_08925 [Curtobacterium flaccumfaciens]|nr:hypothetical protein P9139_08925 [Curtobacterium flaccumfaciens]
MHDTTRTSLPSAAYFAIVAAPLLDSSSGWAWTANRRYGTWGSSLVVRWTRAAHSDA